MLEYDNVVKGKLKLKGKALNVMVDDGVSEKKKKKHMSRFSATNQLTGGNPMHSTDVIKTGDDSAKRHTTASDDYLTPSERRYLEQWEKIDRQRLAKMATKSHRDRIHEFNQYLANLTEHYDIPKVGPG